MRGISPSARRRASRSRPATPRHLPKHCTSSRPPGRELVVKCLPFLASSGSGGGLENPMPEVTVFGFPRSVYVHIPRLILTHKEVPYAFHDMEAEMGSPTHLALHPFDRVPILRHGDFTLYETAAIAGYLDDVFEFP